MDERKINVMYTGEKGADDFDVEMTIQQCHFHEDPFKELSDIYKDCRDKYYYLKKDYQRLTENKIVRFLIKLGFIKINKQR